MERWFDAFIYYANWGTRKVMLALPAGVVSAGVLKPYTNAETFSVRPGKKRTVLTWVIDEEGADDWRDFDGVMPALVSVRHGLLNGDHRALYLGWLAAINGLEEPDTVLEPPVPPGLDKLDAGLSRLVDFLGIDTDLIKVAAKPSATGRRSVAALKNAATERSNRRETAARKARAAKEAAQKQAAALQRQRYLEELTPRLSTLWPQIHEAIATRLPKRYDEAVGLLLDLRDLAAMHGTRPAFDHQLQEFVRLHSNKPSLLRRLQHSGLAE